MAATAVGVGLPLANSGLRPSALIDFVRAADEADLDGVGVGELRSEAFSLVGALVEATTRIKVETSVVAASSRSGPLLAMAAATAHALSGGRFRLGLGAGSPIVAGWQDDDFERPYTNLRAKVREVKRALGGDALEGGFRLAPHLVGPVPLLLAAINERTLRLAGREADGIILNFCGPEQCAALAAQALAVREPGRPFEVIAQVFGSMDEDVERARTAVRDTVGPYLAVPTYRRAMVALSSEQDTERTASAWAEGGRAAAAEHVPERLVDALLLGGSTARLAEQVEAFARAGVTSLRVIPLIPEPGRVGPAHDVVEALGQVASAGGG